MRFALVLLVVAWAGACGSGPSSAVSEGEAARLLVDRNWIDVWPTDKDDRLHVYRFTPAMGGGVYHDRTVFKGEFELFTFSVDGDQLAIHLPHTGERFRTGFRIERVAGPEPFDLKLTLEQSPRGPRVYYGRTAETAGVTLDELLARALFARGDAASRRLLGVTPKARASRAQTPGPRALGD
jgi:hypothetical protein